MKYRYFLNDYNQLLIKPPLAKKSLRANGRLGIDKNNRLFYRFDKNPNWRRQYALSPRVIFKGTWSLNSNHDLTLTLDKNEGQVQGDTLVIKGNIISADTDMLAFEVKSYDSEGLLHAQILKLNITLFADENNRLCFMVRKIQPDTLILGGNWQVNDNQQVIYEYERIDLKSKTKISNNLIFRGFWRIDSANRLTYILKHSSDSCFDFRTQIETPTIYPQKGVIKYRLGIGAREEKPRVRIISLYGAWKFNRSLGLVFEMDYNKEGLKSVEFGADVSFRKNNQVSFNLRNKKGEPLGLTLTFTHKLLKSLDAQAFLRLKRVNEESVVEVGLKVPF